MDLTSSYFAKLKKHMHFLIIRFCSSIKIDFRKEEDLKLYGSFNLSKQLPLTFNNEINHG